MTDSIMGVLKDEKVSVGVTISLVVCFFWFKGWMEDEFITQAKAAENIKPIQESVDRIETMLGGHIKAYEVGKAMEEVQLLEAELRHTVMHEEQMGGETAETRIAKRNLNRRLDRARKYEHCLLTNQPNCGLLEGNG